VEKRVVESRSGDPHAERIANGEIARGESAGLMILRKKDGFVGSVDRSPVGDAAFKRATSRTVELARISPLQVIKERLGFEAWFRLERLFNIGPNVGKGIDTSSVFPRRSSL